MEHPKFILFHLILALCLLVQLIYAQSNIPFPQSVIRHMATRQMRYHHYLWHQVRENWNSFDSSTQREFRRIGWEPPNPSRDRDGDRIESNYAGEDFLYMHRQMIATANQIISQNRERYGPIKGWTTIPAPGDRVDPVPPNYRDMASWKSDDYYNRRIKNVERNLKDPSRLRRMTLNELGIEIEGGIHSSMHMRWSAANPVGYRGGGNINDDEVPYINKRWDDIRYDWLVDTYASQVNPFFWKLHGWIDDRVEDWRRANGLSSIRWRGTWVGGPMANLGNALRKEGQHMTAMDVNPDDPEAVGDVLEQAFAIFKKSGVPESSPRDVIGRKPKHCKKKAI